MNKEQALECIEQLYRYCEKEEIHLKPIIQDLILDLITDEIQEKATLEET